MTIRKTKTSKIISPECFINLKEGSVYDHYRPESVLGEGAFGKVLKVTHKGSGLLRAMKVLKRDKIRDEDNYNIGKLFEEFTILRELDHPNIIKQYEVFQDEHHWYMITEYCNGGELFDSIKQIKSFTEKKAAEIIYQIQSAVQYCHQRNIVHRDQKPENILFVKQNENLHVKLIDFGVSVYFKSGSAMNERQGTAYYVAPEVLNKNYNEKCDVFVSFNVVKITNLIRKNLLEMIFYLKIFKKQNKKHTFLKEITEGDSFFQRILLS